MSKATEEEKEKGFFEMIREFDLGKLSAISKHIDLKEVLGSLSRMNKTQLYELGKALKAGNTKYEAPTINGDFYELSDTLSSEEREIQLKVRKFMNDEIKPIANEYWNKGEFPMHIIPKLAKLDLCGVPLKGHGCPNRTHLMEGIISMEMARVDTSISTFFGVQSGLAMGSIFHCGSEEQKSKWLAPMQKLEILGAFGLTEPEVGSAVAGGLTTKARREGDTWILNGQKKWIGNATFSDITIIWAQDEEDGNVKGFIVEKDAPGFYPEKIENKMALRTVQNALITLKDCKVKEENRLQNANSFKDTAKVLKSTRAGVAWQAVGCARGAYENALAYTTERKQFGKPIASFQLIQDQLVQMLSRLTSMQNMVFRLSKLQDEGKMSDEQASLAKVTCTLHTREIVDIARGIMGGNGILLEYNVARFVADAEALYSYEGTKEINSLIVGRAITGISAFV
jgi:glutaryl-CoA dehydrogenase